MKRFLLVGIGNYTFRPLHGCANDARIARDIVPRNADEYRSPDFDCRLDAAESGLTRDRLLHRLDQSFASGPGCDLFYFAGHGAASHASGDVTLVTTKGTTVSPGVFQDVLVAADNRK